jgi:5-bromo-4-chloroindolyl phosphate hydrolysis protein
VQKDIDVLRKSLQQTNDRIVTLEKMMIQSHVLLEKICAMMPQESKASSESLKKFVHIHSRVSPYVYTNDARFPVTEKFVPWEVRVMILCL